LKNHGDYGKITHIDNHIGAIQILKVINHRWVALITVDIIMCDSDSDSDSDIDIDIDIVL
jgi:hypothetical protein